MADPNRKINLDLPSTDEDSDEPELNPLEVSLVKEFEEEFANRFSEDDQVFTDFCNQKSKPPPIVYPFDGFNNNRGGHRGGRFQNYGGPRHNFDNRRNFDRGGGHQNHHQRYHRDRDSHQQPHHHYNKRPRPNSDQPQGY